MSGWKEEFWKAKKKERKKRNCDGRRSVWRIASSFIKHCYFSTSSTSTTANCSCYQQPWQHRILCSAGTEANPQKCPQAILCSSASKVHPQKFPQAPQPYSTRHPRSTSFPFNHTFLFYLFFQLGLLHFQQLIPCNSYTVYFFFCFLAWTLSSMEAWGKCIHAWWLEEWIKWSFVVQSGLQNSASKSIFWESSDFSFHAVNFSI